MPLLDDWTKMPQGQAAQSYASLIYRRATDGMLIDDWEVDWSRQPFTHAVYPSSTTYTMPLPGPDSTLLAETVHPTPQALAEALHIALGIVAQRLSVNLNDGHTVYSQADSAKWGRTTASGGGRYCGDVYLVESGDAAAAAHSAEPHLEPKIGLPAGIYHYSILHHAWELLAPGDYTDAVADAQGHDHTAQRYLLTTINYWRSGFKYNDFAYQATAMDLGTVAGTLIEIMGSGLSSSWDMWVAETSLSDLLGLNPDEDGVYAVQAWGSSRPSQPAPTPPRQLPQRLTGPEASTRTFLTTKALQREMSSQPQRPQEFPIPSAVAELDTTDRPHDWLGSLLHRESSFGRFTGAPVPAEALRTMLQRADTVGDLFTTGPGARWEFLVYVTAVDGLTPGLYSYRGGQHQQDPLTLLVEGPQNDFLASTYFLRNYDGHRAAATVILCANVFEATQLWGVRGYRYINAIVGAMCQAMSVQAVRHGISTGTALGFDALKHAHHAGLEAERMTPLLMMMTGVDDEKCGRFSATTTTLTTILEDLA